MRAATSCLKGSYEVTDYIISDFDALDRHYIVELDSVYNILPFIDRGYIGYNNRHRDYDPSTDPSDASVTVREYGYFTGGFSLSMKCDSLVKEGHVTRSEYCVADSTGHRFSAVFAVYYQNPDPAQMPDHDIVFVSSVFGSCTPSVCFVQNTNATVNLVRYGDADIPPFAQGDYIKLQAVGILDGKTSAPAEMYLANYDGNGLSVVKKWTEFNLSPVGDFDYLDFTLSSNRTDIPLFFCLDDLNCRIQLSR